MSATNVLNGNGATPTAAPARSENAGLPTTQNTLAAESQSLPSNGGLMSFKKHFRRSKKIEPDIGSPVSAGGASGGGTANAPMLNGGVDTSPNVIHLDDGVSDSSSDSESIIEEDYPNGPNTTGSRPAATDSPVTTTGGTSARTASFPITDDQVKAPTGAAAGAESHPSGETRQQQKPQHQQHPPTTFTVPGPPPPIVRPEPEPKKVITSGPPVPAKVPEPPLPTGAIITKIGPAQGSTQNLQAVQSLQAIQRAQQTQAANRNSSATKLPRESKEKSGGLLSGIKKLRRSDSRRESPPATVPAPQPAVKPVTAAAQATTTGRTASSHALNSVNPNPGPVTTPPASQMQTQTLPALATSLPPPPPPIQASPDKGRGVDSSSVPNSLRPGGGMPIQQQQYLRQPQQQQQQMQMHIQQQPQQQSPHGYEQHTQQQQPHHMLQQVPQQAVMVQQYHQQSLQQGHQLRQIPCDECKAFYDAAWAQSEINMYALSSQLAAAHQQSASQIAILHERDAQIVELNGLVERLRTRIQEQVKQLEQVPAGISGVNSFPGLNGYASGGVGQLPDGQIRSRWKSLRWQIRQCVEARLTALPSSTSTPVSPERAPFLRRLTPDYDKFLNSRKGSVYLVEAAIWAVLADNVFSDARQSSRMCWAARWSAPLAKMNDNMLHNRPNDPAFHQWRVQTAVFVRSLEEKGDGEQPSSVTAPYVEAVVRQLEVEVGVLLALGTSGPSGAEDSNGGPTGHGESSTSSPTSSTSSSSVLRRQLFDVVAEAIGLDADLCQQRPWYYVHYPTSSSGHRYGMPFDAQEMENVAATGELGGSSGIGGGSETNIGLSASAHSNNNSVASTNSQHGQDDISLVIRPALFKAGNSRGEAYDQVTPIEPSIVCQATPTGRALRRWAGGRRDRSRSRG
ncbi:hypothetical protein SEUCBS140593_004588 [Sporothrix eucalyptigena]|uniref:Uncharacterized protein n=1 Tax=Sporothrix eucalyptigena TaxID=1812306 RepID=A0ABP0BPF0_9PEZI